MASQADNARYSIIAITVSTLIALIGIGYLFSILPANLSIAEGTITGKVSCETSKGTQGFRNAYTFDIGQGTKTAIESECNDLADLQVTQKMTVLYNKENPRESCLIRALTMPFLIILLGLVCSTIEVALLRRKQSVTSNMKSS